VDAVTHAVHVQAGSLLASVLGQPPSEPVLTNTFHHQAVRDLAAGLVAVAYTTDGTVEAVEAPRNAFVLGVQWHPEHLASKWVEHRRLFQALTAAATPAAGRLRDATRQTA
jgi:putative glutamine amidotransferase